MTHRAESIITTVKTIVTGLTTTGAHVYRGRVYPLQESELPGILIYMGQDKIIRMHSQSLVDSVLSIHIVPVVKTATSQVDTVLNQIREEATVALQADFQLGLSSYVMGIEEVGAEEPELSGDGDQPIATMRTTWQVHYRRSRTNPGA
jgi:hypothetical protein